MKNLKKLIALSLVAVMSASIIACNNTNNTKKEGGGSEKETEAQDSTTKDGGENTDKTEAETEKGTENTEKSGETGDTPELKWITVGSGMPKNYDAWKEHINKYLAEKIGVTVDVEVNAWGDWDNRRNVVTSTGADYDILFTDFGKYANEVRIGAHLDITDLVKEEAPDLVEFIPETYWDATKIGGVLYAVPTYKDSSMSQFIIWDKKYVDKYDIKEDTIKEVSDLTPFVKEITEERGEPAFTLFTAGAHHFIYGYDYLGTGIKALGVRYDDKDAKVVSVFEQEDIMNRLKTLHEWYTAGYINEDAPTKEEVDMYKPISVAQGWSGAAKTTWGPAMDVEAEAFQIFDTVVSSETVQGSLNAISANSKYPKEALKLLQTVNLDTYVRDSLAYGLEGEDWEYKDKLLHRIKEEWTMAAYTQGTFFNISQLDNFDFNQWDEVKELNEKAIASPVLGFSFDISSVEDELTNCTEIYKRYASELLCGMSNPEEAVPAMMEELKGEGFDDIVAEAQKQVDEFIAKQKS